MEYEELYETQYETDEQLDMLDAWMDATEIEQWEIESLIA